jgi:heme/copper-type cytochrome/quinol oxidase subunit 2
MMGLLAILTTFVYLAASSAWAQATAPSSTPGEPGSPPWLQSYWLIILVFAVVAAALAYFTFRKKQGR